MSDEDRYTRITLRIPRDLHTKLQTSSEVVSHSMNAEIVQRLEDSFELPAADMVDMIIKLQRLESARTMARIDWMDALRIRTETAESQATIDELKGKMDALNAEFRNCLHQIHFVVSPEDEAALQARGVPPNPRKAKP